MKYVVLLIFLFSPVHIQPQRTPFEEAEYNPWLKEGELENVQNELPRAKQIDELMIAHQQTPEEEAREIVMLYKQAIEKAKEELVTANERLNKALVGKQNAFDLLQTLKATTEELNRNISQLQSNVDSCKNEIEQYTNQIQGKNPATYQQEIDDIEKRIQEVLREKNDKIPLSQKQNEEKNAVLNRLNDEKSKVNIMKNEKEKLLRDIEQCQMVLKNCNSTVSIPECSILSGPISFLSNIVDYKSSLIHNLLSSILGLDGKKS